MPETLEPPMSSAAAVFGRWASCTDRVTNLWAFHYLDRFAVGSMLSLLSLWLELTLASTSTGVITSVLDISCCSGPTHGACRSHTVTAWLRSTMQCSCHSSHTFVPRTRPVAASSLQLTSSFQGSQVSHARFAGSPLQCKPIRSSGRQHRCVTSMASKGQSRSQQLPLPTSVSVGRA